MKEKSDDLFITAVLIFLFLVLGLLVGGWISKEATLEEVRSDAVRFGVGEWTISTNGEVKFRWKTPAKEAK